MTTQTLIHLLYFLPALIVYGVWTWYSWEYMEEIRDGYDRWVIGSWLVVHLFVYIFLVQYGIANLIKYFSN